MSTYVTLEFLSGAKLQVKKASIQCKVNAEDFDMMPGLVCSYPFNTTPYPYPNSFHSAKECVAAITKKYKSLEEFKKAQDLIAAELKDIRKKITDLLRKKMEITTGIMKTTRDDQKMKRISSSISALQKKDTEVMAKNLEYTQLFNALNVHRNGSPCNFTDDFIQVILDGTLKKYAIVKLSNTNYILVKEFELK